MKGTFITPSPRLVRWWKQILNTCTIVSYMDIPLENEGLVGKLPLCVESLRTCSRALWQHYKNIINIHFMYFADECLINLHMPHNSVNAAHISFSDSSCQVGVKKGRSWKRRDML